MTACGSPSTWTKASTNPTTGNPNPEQDSIARHVAGEDIAEAAHGADQIAAQGALTGALGRLIAVAENYPDLKASANFMELQEELASTENKVAFSRQFYNDSVMTYDNKREQFPAVIFAGMLGFKEEPYWKIEEDAAREAPKVSFK